MSFNSKNPLVQHRQLKAQRLSIPFRVTANASPALVALSSDEIDVLYMQSEGINQIHSLEDVEEPAPPAGSPNLGSSASYAVLGASTITNTGSSVVTGDFGLYPGTSVTGFPPGTVIGTQNITNGLAQLAQVDALAAYNDLFGRAASSITANLDGQTLGAGVYTESAGTFNLATSGNATLTLNGSASDLFIFRCSSTLTTGAGGTPTILLTGGALASNVYWVCGSSATLNVSGSGAFVGSVIATASVTIGGGSVNGRLFALNAAITISAATAIVKVSSLFPGSLIDANGDLNFLIKLRPDDSCFKVLRASVTDRVSGAQHPLYLTDADGIDLNGNIILTLNSSVNFATTSFDGCLDVDYSVSE